MKYTNQNAERVIRALVEGPMGAEIEAQAESDRVALCSKLRQEYETGQAKYLTELATMQSRLDELAAKLNDHKRQIEPLEKEWLKLSWLVADKRAAATEHRDRYWAQLNAVADPRIAAYRSEFEARLRGCETMKLSWVAAPPRTPYEMPKMAGNALELDRAGQYLLGALDATVRWAREGLQGEEVDRAYAEIMRKFPRIPMGKDAPTEIPPEVGAAPTDWSTLRQP